MASGNEQVKHISVVPMLLCICALVDWMGSAQQYLVKKCNPLIPYSIIYKIYFGRKP